MLVIQWSPYKENMQFARSSRWHVCAYGLYVQAIAHTPTNLYCACSQWSDEWEQREWTALYVPTWQVSNTSYGKMVFVYTTCRNIFHMWYRQKMSILVIDEIIFVYISYGQFVYISHRKVVYTSYEIYLLWQFQCLFLTDTLFLCTLPFYSCKIDNIEVISLPLDYIPEHCLSSYFSPPREICDDQHDDTNQLGQNFLFNNRIWNILNDLEKFEFRLNVVHNIDKKSHQNVLCTA